jgi:hypothetical protein
VLDLSLFTVQLEDFGIGGKRSDLVTNDGLDRTAGATRTERRMRSIGTERARGTMIAVPVMIIAMMGRSVGTMRATGRTWGAIWTIGSAPTFRTTRAARRARGMRRWRKDVNRDLSAILQFQFHGAFGWIKRRGLSAGCRLDHAEDDPVLPLLDGASWRCRRTTTKINVNIKASSRATFSAARTILSLPRGRAVFSIGRTIFGRISSPKGNAHEER